VIDAHTGVLNATIPVGTYPFTALMSPDGTRVYVSNWGDATASVIDADTRNLLAAIPVGNHPSSMLSDGGDKI
jgi:YVTN family beta-propeller protein